MLWTRLNMGFFGTKGRVTPKSIIRSGRNSNLIEILCLSRLSARLIKIWLKQNRLCSRQISVFVFRHSRASNSKVKNLIRPEFELTPDFYGCPGYLHLKTIWSNVNVLSSGQHFLHYKSMGKFFIAQGWVTPMWTLWSGPKIELVQDFMTVFVTCKFDEDQIKNEDTYIRTPFSPL